MTHKIVRKYFDDNHPDHNKVIARGLTLEEAQAHCSREDTHERGVWMDVYYEEDRSPRPQSVLSLACALQTKDPEKHIYRSLGGFRG